MDVELERIVPLKVRVLPFFWVSNGSREAIEETLLTSPDVESIKRLTELEISQSMVPKPPTMRLPLSEAPP